MVWKSLKLNCLVYVLGCAIPPSICYLLVLYTSLLHLSTNQDPKVQFCEKFVWLGLMYKPGVVGVAEGVVVISARSRPSSQQ